MKKVLLLMLSVAFFASCSPTQNAAKQSAKDFRGDWTLTSVTPREAGIQITSLFNQAPQSC
ncbi:lipocalin family protein, partial [Ornithobacterium rhinotracheale]